MKRVLLDENIDRKLKRSFDPSYEVVTVPERGWSGKKNGELLRVAELEFDVLVTLDRNLQHQQNLPKYALAVVLILSKSSRRADIEPAMAEVNRIVAEAKAGTLVAVTV